MVNIEPSVPPEGTQTFLMVDDALRLISSNIVALGTHGSINIPFMLGNSHVDKCKLISGQDGKKNKVKALEK